MPTLHTLPTELLLMISESLFEVDEWAEIDEIVDEAAPPHLAALTLVNRRLHAIFDPILWRFDQNHPDGAVRWAVCRGRTDILEKALEYGLQLGSAMLSAPIHLAVEQWQSAALAWLLDHGVPVDENAIGPSHPQIQDFVYDNFSPLYTALYERNQEAAIILLSRNARYHFIDSDTREPLGRFQFLESALHLAIREGLHMVVRYLVEERGADVNEIITDRDMPIYWVPQPVPTTPLQLAMYSQGNIKNGVIQTLLDHGADINAESRPDLTPPLTLALQLRNFDYARVLLNAGAQVNPRNISEGIPSPLMACILSYACDYGDYGPRFGYFLKMITRQLIKKGADLDCSFNGNTPLTTAIFMKNTLLLRRLLKAGADISKPREADGCTPIELARAVFDLRLGWSSTPAQNGSVSVVAEGCLDLSYDSEEDDSDDEMNEEDDSDDEMDERDSEPESEVLEDPYQQYYQKMQDEMQRWGTIAWMWRPKYHGLHNRFIRPSD
ncbi:ankyrin repeat-containing domain protein [Hypoxylon rubiginosum]|uniref:Ankyrin repeat-containing domain protein n=1 Tax=Hypoxylon rubiginosum TaxID=110542 RepID=A0ACC0D0C0_9PEZI|nr:ankyrin repeat-containing domain protein [Hypoxylon rubiginosum]